MRARALVVVVLLLSYGAVGARQPAVRLAVPLPAPAAQIAEAPSRFFDRPRPFRARRRADALRGRPRRRRSSTARQAETGAPRFRTTWRNRSSSARHFNLAGDAAARVRFPTIRSLTAILSDRSTALLYHGLAGLDDETLAWLGPERDTLAASVAARRYVRRVRTERSCQGRANSGPWWRRTSRCGRHHRRQSGEACCLRPPLFGDESGLLAWFYDSMAEPRRAPPSVCDERIAADADAHRSRPRALRPVRACR